MGNSKPVHDLIKALGIPETEKGALKADIFSYLDQVTGSERGTCKLPSSTIPGHIESFIEEDKGREWFKRGDILDDWRYPVPRLEVAHTLVDLTNTWLRGRREALKKKDAGHSNGKKSAATEQASSNRVERSPTVTSSKTTFLAVNTEHASDTSRFDPQLFEYSDEETDASLEDHDKDDNDESLPDVYELIGTPAKAPAERPATSTPTIAPDNCERTVATLVGSPQVARSTSSAFAEPVTPARTMNGSLLSPPTTGLKRKADDTASMVSIAQDNTEAQEGSTRKRVRLPSGAASAQSIVPVMNSTIPNTAQRSSDSPLATVADQTFSNPASNGTPSTPNISALLTAFASHTSPYAQRAASLKADDLASIPDMVMDYIGHCIRSSLAKVNDRKTAPTERKKYQERCKLFRDLYADIESRILSLAYERAEKESEAEETDLEEEGGMHERKVQVSSFCLWD